MGFQLDATAAGETRLGRALPLTCERRGMPGAWAIAGIGLFFAGLPTLGITLILLGAAQGQVNAPMLLISTPFVLIGLWLIKLGLTKGFEKVSLIVDDSQVIFSRSSLWGSQQFVEPLASYALIGEPLDFADPKTPVDSAGSVCRVLLEHGGDHEKDIELYRASDTGSLTKARDELSGLLRVAPKERVFDAEHVARVERLGSLLQRQRLFAGALGVLCALGGFYAVYVLDKSGHEAARLVFERNDVTHLGVIDVTTGGQRQAVVGPVALSPRDNPVRVNVAIDYSSQRGQQLRLDSSRDYFTLAVRMKDEAGDLVWQDGARVLRQRKEATYQRDHATATVRTFDVPAPGRYSFEVDFQPPSFTSTDQAALVVRTNVWKLSPAVLLVFAALALACLIGGVAAHLRFRQSAQPNPTK